MRLSRSDVVLAGLGIAVAVAIFIAQGPYKNWWQYAIPFVPICVAAACAGVARLLQATEVLRRALALLQEKYDLMTSLRGTSEMVVRVLNEAGDIDYEREYRLELIRKCIVNTTKQEHIWSEVAIPSIPPLADVLESSNQNQALVPDRNHEETVDVGGKAHTHYSWIYRLQDPLRKPGDFVRYRYRVTIPKSEASAFTPEGGQLFVECGALDVTIEATLVAPAGFTIEILESKTVDYDGTERALPAEKAPSLGAGSEVLSWTPPYAHGVRFVCRYRCVTKSK